MLTKQLFLTARPIAVEELVQRGVAIGAFDAADFDLQLHKLVKDVLALAPLATASTKQSINEISQGKFDAAAISSRQAMTIGSSDFREGRDAFAGKRAPRFTGS